MSELNGCLLDESGVCVCVCESGHSICPDTTDSKLRESEFEGLHWVRLGSVGGSETGVKSKAGL